jgi:hypothetical protein
VFCCNLCVCVSAYIYADTHTHYKTMHYYITLALKYLLHFLIYAFILVKLGYVMYCVIEHTVIV